MRASAWRAARGLLGLQIGLQVGHGLLHHARALHHLRQEHLARAEQVADHVHAGHQRALDHEQRPAVLLAGLLGVGVDVVDDALDQGVGEPLLDRALPPGRLRRPRPSALPLTVSAKPTRRSVASGRRFSSTSSTRSSRSLGISS